MRFKVLLTAVALAVTASVLTTAALATTEGGTVVKVGKSDVGRVLVDSRGMTLSMWAPDKGSRSTCYGTCASYWPPVTTAGKPAARSGAKTALLGTTRRSDGRQQVTYRGHPLYRFSLDKKPGQASGEGLTDFGGRWDPLSAAGKAVRTATPGSGYPYKSPLH
jgi:predicted lipoprotein with Yx(FWY)xxD motif